MGEITYNDNKSNNSEVESNKQIEKMAIYLYHNTTAYNTCWEEDCGDIAKILYKAGYRKERVGKWETIPDYSNALITYRHICSVCGCFYKDIRPNGHKYCHECGARMTKGAD